VATVNLNGRDIEAPEGAPLVEVIKDAGIFISNLCYIDGAPPYGGCRSCLVEIEGMRGLQLSCTAKVTDGMVVRTGTAEAKASRQAVVSLIMSYHSDRCLTCHRVVKCKPGDTCLRDDTVTHRCLTCSKNYRCELQTTCEMLGMAGYEPWDGDERTWYLTEHSPADHGNPFLEFDPQMCIICTRCVRACDEIRHTGAIALAGRGPTTRIEFGAGGPVHESNCDFCGACIDVCPTATLMEHANKWAATQTERWTATTCTQCSVGCSIYIGTKKGRGVIVRPDTHANPVSREQLCVRGRFHYDAVRPGGRLSGPLIRRTGQTPAGPGGGQHPADWEEALEFTAASLARVREQHGPEAIGFLASPFASNEENYLAGKVARAIAGTNNVASSTGAVAAAACAALKEAFGSEVLPADLRHVAISKTILAVADDLESSHQVAALRAKDAAVRAGANLIVVSAVWGELCDFAEVWVQPAPGQEAATLAALDAALNGREATVPAALGEPLAKAAELLSAARDDESRRPLSIVYGLPHLGPGRVRATVAALANIAVTCCGADAPGSLLVLPHEANVWGMRDTGAAPDLLPGHRPVGDEAARRQMERLWGAALPPAPGLTFEQMVSDGRLKALVVVNDNPMMLAADRAAVRRALESLEFLAVIDSVPTDTARLAHAVLPDTGPWAREGTTTSADRRLLALHEATAPAGEARQGWRILSELGARLAERFKPGEVRISYRSAEEIANEMADVIPLYRNARHDTMDPGEQQAINGLGPKRAVRQNVATPAAAAGGGFSLIASRSLFTSYEAAAARDPDADRMHREEAVSVNPADAAALGIADGDTVILRNSCGELRIRARLTNAVPQKALWAPLYYDGGAVLALFDAGAAVAAVEVARA
jgi:predicted molibdopterin-dependent oxidoreductase YjgC